MAERCELCGARWDETTTTCRECGAPRRAPPPPTTPELAGPPHAAETSPGTAVPPAMPAPAAGHTAVSRRPLVLAIAGGAVVLAIGLAFALAPDDEPNPSDDPQASSSAVDGAAVGSGECDELTALAGQWRFTTITTGARKDKRLGVHEFYEMTVSVEQCAATAALSKTGRDGREPFEEQKVPRAFATLSPGEGPHAFGHGATFELRNQAGEGSGHRFVFVREGERLLGTWRHTGKRWRRQAQYGVLEGRAGSDAQPPAPDRSTQPCAVQCLTPLDATQMIEGVDQAMLAECIAACP